MARKDKAILNYTTQIDAERTVAEVIRLLVAKGAKAIHQEYDNGKILAVSFIMLVGGVPVKFLLPSNTEGVHRVLQRNAPPRYNSKQQAERVGWRILKDWVEAQIALVESSQVDMGQVFMPYAMGSDGRTMYELFVENNQKQLSSGT